MRPDIAVLVVDDDPIARTSHVAYVDRVPGFRAVAGAGTAAAAIRRLSSTQSPRIDLVLLDMNLPDRHGLEIIRTLRAGRHPADVIVVTSARELDTVRSAISSGVVQYLLKPFAFATLRERLERYAAYRQSVVGGSGGPAGSAAGQSEVDALLGTLRAPGPVAPAGLLGQSVQAAITFLADHGELSAPHLAQLMGTSRVTARRYLEHLVEIGHATREHRYGGAGRPVVVYLRGGPAEGRP
ncbi:Response regulator of citrate/malate metabolism [Nakamurella panacisegetis]|uniref:Transcriptional regulatory protein n=1 Tax=Nakamurella panacisegetis TaxID=1090615 RepID=A0A1H0SS99_9ACTN|nr:response regulator [Nakamurella panacisegetis]SDP44647.1 Response regulator of citrate/malate metabolism [Nakamurella panacisegetis]